MSTLAHVFEAAGIATITLGIVEGQLRSTAPPRGLFVDFPLGRPLGKPNDATFQSSVLDSAFNLLDATEPTISSFGQAVVDEGEVLVCQVPPIDDPDAHPAVAEVRGIRPAYDRSVAKYGDRIGAFRLLGPDGVGSAIEAFQKVAQGTSWKEAGIPGIPARVAQDIRGYYEAAALSLTDHNQGAFEATRWFMHRTEAGKVLLSAQAAMKQAGVKEPIWRFLTTDQGTTSD